MLRSAIGVLGLALTCACSRFEAAPSQPDASTTSDAAAAPPLGEAGADADAFPGIDLDPSPACSKEEPLLGSNDNTPADAFVDGIPIDAIDAYGFDTGLTPNRARCIRIFIERTDGATDVLLGVYANADNKPAKLITTARVAVANKGWYFVPLDAPVLLAPRTTLWLAMSPITAAIYIPTKNTEVSYTLRRQAVGRSAGAPLPDPFAPTSAGLTKDAAIYLSR